MATSAEPKKYDCQTPVICDQCETPKNVNSYCLDCKGNICDKCKENRLHREHELLPRTDPRVAKARKLAKQRCKVHPGNYYVSFCKKCNTPCCQVCVAKEHRRHSCCDIADVVDEAKSDLQTCLNRLVKSTLPAAERIHEAIDYSIIEYENSMKEIIKQSRQRFEYLRIQLDNAERDWLLKMNKMKMDDLAELRKRRKKKDIQIKKTKDLIKILKAKVTDDEYVSVLAFNDKRPDLPDMPEEYEFSWERIHFKPSQYKLPNDKELVGSLKQKNKCTVIEMTKRECKYLDQYHERFRNEEDCSSEYSSCTPISDDSSENN